MTVTAIRVDHGPVPAFGYRVDFGGRSVVFAGDTRKSDNLIAKSQGVDVLIHPMLGFTPEQLTEQTRGGARRRAALQLLPPPEDVAEVVRYLTLEAPDYLTGARIAVDGGAESVS